MWWLLAFAPADGTVGSVQNPADGGSGEAPLAVQSCEGLENAAFTNTTRQMNACFSHTNAKQILQAFFGVYSLLEVLHLHSLPWALYPD